MDKQEETQRNTKENCCFPRKKIAFEGKGRPGDEKKEMVSEKNKATASDAAASVNTAAAAS